VPLLAVFPALVTMVMSVSLSFLSPLSIIFLLLRMRFVVSVMFVMMSVMSVVVVMLVRFVLCFLPMDTIAAVVHNTSSTSNRTSNSTRYRTSNRAAMDGRLEPPTDCIQPKSPAEHLGLSLPLLCQQCLFIHLITG
jgi:uncharacterized membrane protein